MRRAFFAGLAMVLVSAPALAHRRVWVGVHLGWPWWYPWGWGPVVVRAHDPDVAVVDTDISPEHARVLLDGQLIGTADDFDGNPDYLYLRPGTYTLEFVLPGYEPQRVELDAQPGRFFPLDLQLVRNPKQKAAPWYDRPEGLPVARVFGKGEARRPTEARPDPSLRRELKRKGEAERPESKKALLRFAVEPGQAAVYLDGEFLGTGEELGQLVRGLAVEPGSHRIEVLAPGFAPETRTVTVESGQDLEVQVKLVPGG
ncbi:MAG: PEGA domain-containing protein [Thermoanaerobaculum sp.]|nr:PEGA domain-containing protein [Thermoanaerobaculum sp.]MDW7968262.1 PEGA domain-containing protein [Thermoanaerobaculum sp.]